MVDYESAFLWVFWAGVLFTFYTYLGYPLALAVRRRLAARPIRKDYRYTPSISFLIVAHNEEKVIRQKLDNTLALAYAGERDIVVVSDGSTDRTNEIVAEFQGRGVRLVPDALRQGKARAVNDGLTACRGEIVLLSDARQMYDTDAMRELVANFADPTVGGVTGDLQFQKPSTGASGEQIGLYWHYEKWIRRLQSDTDSTPVVTGAIYAIRRALFRPLPVGVIADDLFIPMTIVQLGYRVVYDPSAKAYDYFQPSLQQEYRKRVRTISGSYQYVAVRPSVLSPFTNRIWFDFVSHKVCRILAPFALMAVLVANVAINDWPYQLTLALQGGFYTLAVLGAIRTRQAGTPTAKIIAVPYTFLMLNAVACVAFFKLATGAQTHLWEKQ